jgi:C-terminal processing protease CtpA/Prc
VTFKIRRPRIVALVLAHIIALAACPTIAAAAPIPTKQATAATAPLQLYDKITSVIQNEFYDNRARSPEFKRAIARYRAPIKTREDAINAARSVIKDLNDPYTWLLDQTIITRREAKRSGLTVSPPVKIKVETPRGEVQQPVRIVSERPSVEADWLSPDTAYLQISDFDNRLLMSQLQRAVTNYNIASAKNLVLDLRGNVGGFVTAAAQVLGFLMGSTPNIATLKMAKDVQPLSLDWPKSNPQFKGKLVVLVDHRTASASELVAATVQKQHRGKIIGERTAGSNLWKGDREIEPGLVLYLAFAEWKVSPAKFTGVIPDVVVPGRKEQLQRALKVLSEE